ncbi:MAG: hypothetical protein ACI9YH_000582 [Colwellia sp.]|jgi:hypothetical protein
MKIITLLLINIMASFLVHAVQEEHQYSPESKQLLLKMQQQIQGTLLTVSENEKKAGFDMSNFYYEIKLPAQQKAYLGLVLDTQNPKDGYKILSTTPGSIAEKLDIVVGDSIKSINGVKVDIINHTKALEQLKQPIVDSTLNLTVESKGKIKIISSKIVTNYIPEINIEIGKKPIIALQETSIEDDQDSCGQINVGSTFMRTKRMFPMTLIRLNGRNKINHGAAHSPSFSWPVAQGKTTAGNPFGKSTTGQYLKNSYKVRTGKNTFRVESPAAIGALFHPRRRYNKYNMQEVEIMIEKDKRYFFAAQVDDELKTWKPVLVKVEDRACELSWHQK